MALPGTYRNTPSSLVGGDIAAIILRQSLRLRALVRGLMADETNPSIPYINAIPISVVTQETYTYQAEVTKHAVESGVIFSDHVIEQPLRVDVSFGVSNLKLEDARSALEEFETLIRARVRLTLMTKHRQLNDMIMTDLEVDNSLPAWGALTFRASFQQVRLVSLEAGKYSVTDDSGRDPVTGGGAGASANIEVNKGGVVPDAQPEGSILYNWLYRSP